MSGVPTKASISACAVGRVVSARTASRGPRPIISIIDDDNRRLGNSDRPVRCGSRESECLAHERSGSMCGTIVELKT